LTLTPAIVERLPEVARVTTADDHGVTPLARGSTVSAQGRDIGAVGQR
jgi:hypothetical protein